MFRWINFTTRNLVSFTLIFAVVDLAVFTYFRRRQRLLAEEINEML